VYIITYNGIAIVIGGIILIKRIRKIRNLLPTKRNLVKLYAAKRDKIDDNAVDEMDTTILFTR